MTKFSELSVGDVFNTISGRFVKTSNFQVMSIIDNSLFKLGYIMLFDSEREVIPLYMAKKSVSGNNFLFDDTYYD